MINLVDNAIAAMKGRGHIRITVLYLQDAPTVRIEVADDGPGIPDEHKSRLFEPDFSTKKTGMGIGLSIVSTIVADHSGSIRVEDNHPRGAKFVILLPVGDHQPERRPPEGLTAPESGSEPTLS